MKDQDIEKIAELMKKKGVSKGDLADCWKKDNSAASLFFKGNRDLSIDEFDNTAALLGMRSTELFATMRGESIESADNQIFAMAIEAAKQAVDVTKAKLGKLEFCQYAFTLYQHALSEKRISGNAIVTPGIAVFLLEQRLKQPQAS